MSPRQPVDQVADGAEPAPASASRRRFVRHVGLGAAALGAAAVAGSTLTGVASAQSATSDPPDLGAADIELVQFLQSLSWAAEQGLATAGDKSFLESEFAEMIRQFSRHHRDQAENLGALLTDEDAITAPNPTMLARLDGDVNGAADQTALLNVLRTFESDLAATMLTAVGDAESFVVAEDVATLLPVVGQQAAALGSANGTPIDEWLPAFATTDGAFTQAAFPTR